MATTNSPTQHLIVTAFWEVNSGEESTVAELLKDFLPQAQPRGDAFARFIHDGHGRRNNEPFMAPLAKMDLPALLASLGFTEIQILPFAESDGALDPAYPHWRFPWAIICARKGA